MLISIDSDKAAEADNDCGDDFVNFRHGGRRRAARHPGRPGHCVIIYLLTRLVYSLSLTMTLVMTLLMTSTSHDVQRLVTSLHHGGDVITARLARDVMAEAERSLLSDASKQRDTWRHDVTACQRHVGQLAAHVSQLTSGDAWHRLDTNKLPGSI